MLLFTLPVVCVFVFHLSLQFVLVCFLLCGITHIALHPAVRASLLLFDLVYQLVKGWGLGSYPSAFSNTALSGVERDLRTVRRLIYMLFLFVF